MDEITVQGTCPKCGRTIGARIGSSLATLASNAIERELSSDDNEIRCSNCQEYVTPENMSLVGG